MTFYDARASCLSKEAQYLTAVDTNDQLNLNSPFLRSGFQECQMA